MKNSIMLLGFLLLLAHSLIAQISLDSMSYPETEIGTDSLKVTTYFSAFPSFAPMAGGTWDLSIITDSTPVLFACRIPASSPYQFADSTQYNFAGFNYQGNVESSITNSGLLEFGITISRISYSIHSITTGLTDSFIIANQNMLYTEPRTKIIFPSTNSSTWYSFFHSDLNIYLTYLLLGDTLTPGFIRKYTYEKDSVIGWGKMSVKDATGSSSAFLDVLQVQTMTMHIDSFFLNGLPSSTFADIFSVTQGQKDTVYEQNFYRQSEVTPLAEVEFRDASYTQPYKATTHVQRLSNVGVPVTGIESKWKAYPNPICGNSLYLEMPACTGTAAYELTGMDGQKVLTGIIPVNVQTAKLDIPASVAPGIYNLQMYVKGCQVFSTLVDLMK